MICERLFFWAWLYWSGSWIYDSWNGLSSKSYTERVKSSISWWQAPRVWCLPIIPIYDTYLVLSSTLLSWILGLSHLWSSAYHIMLKTLWFYLLLSNTSLWKFDLQMIAWDTPYHQLSISQHSTPCPHRLSGEYFREKRSFSGLMFPLTKGLRYIAELPPFFFFFLFWKRWF